MKKLGFGLMRLPLSDPSNTAMIDQEQVNAMVDSFLAAGCTYFDTAYSYHDSRSEVAARRALAERHPREAFLLADKMPCWLVEKEADLHRLFHEQLERCGVDYFDYYLLHNLYEKSYADMAKHNAFTFMTHLKVCGQAKHIGFSFHDKAELLDRILTEHPQMEFVQLQINYADWENEAVQARLCYEVARKHKKQIIIMEPVRGGALAKGTPEMQTIFHAHNNKASLASWALRYAASLEGVMVVLSGMSNMEQIEENLATLVDFRPLSPGEYAVVDEVRDLLSKIDTIPCTGCNYCLAGCPKKINIPSLFDLYNSQKQFGFDDSYFKRYAFYTVGEDKAPASACIACAQCEEHCPQHIGIIERLRGVAQIMER